MRIEIEFYKDGDSYGAYISDDCGGSGIEVCGTTPEELAGNMKLYLEDYAVELDD